MAIQLQQIIRRRRERINEDAALLEKAMADAPPGNPAEREMAEIVKAQHRARTEGKRARRS
jgi:hypothetical protein